MDLREKLDEIIVRALAAQQAFAEPRSSIYEHPSEPKSEDVVAEIVSLVERAVAEERERCAALVHELWENGIPAQEFAKRIRVLPPSAGDR